MTDLERSRPSEANAEQNPAPHAANHGAESRWDGPAWMVAMCTLWIAQPLYDLLGGMPSYFLVRGLSTSGALSDVALFGLLAFVLPPLVFIALAETLGLFGLRKTAYAGSVGMLAGLAALLVGRLLGRLLGRSWEGVGFPAWLLIPAAVAIGVASTRLLTSPGRGEKTRYVLKLLALLAPLAPALFFLRPEIRGELTTGLRLPEPLPPLVGTEEVSALDAHVDAHIIVLVLDELPVFTLLDTQGVIDAELFPHLGELSRTATFFRNARTPSVFTQHAVPALAAGRAEGSLVPATVRSYPENLLTLLGGGRRVVSDEPITALDPNRALPARGERLAALATDSALVLAHAAAPESWSNALPWPALRATVGDAQDPTERFESFLGRLASETDAALQKGEQLLVFSHLLLPHHPWLRDERGERYDGGDEILIAGVESPQIGAIHARWRDDWETVLDDYERHVLQTRHADRLVGGLLELLREKGLFDRSMIVVAADHGIRFAPGQFLRQPGGEKADSLVHVPLLVKMPGQNRGLVDDTPRSNLDVLPTILRATGLDAASLDLPGSSLLLPKSPPPADQSMESASYQELRQRWLKRRELAGPGGFGPWHEQLAGRSLPVDGVPIRDWVVDLDRPARFDHVAPDLPPPRRLSGRLLPRRPEALAELAESEGALPLGIAIDGVMVATTMSSRARANQEREAEHLEFSVLLPAESVTPGPHRVVVYLLEFEDDVVLPPRPVPQRLRSGALPDVTLIRRAPIRRAAHRGTRGEARAIRLEGAGAAMEIFGWLPGQSKNGAEMQDVFVYLGDQMLTRARWIGPADDLENRYRFGSLPEGARTFRAVVPIVSKAEDLRVVALRGSGEQAEARELPLAVDDESVWRVTGPFFLHPDPRTPPAAYQNY